MDPILNLLSRDTFTCNLLETLQEKYHAQPSNEGSKKGNLQYQESQSRTRTEGGNRPSPTATPMGAWSGGGYLKSSAGGYQRPPCQIVQTDFGNLSLTERADPAAPVRRGGERMRQFLSDEDAAVSSSLINLGWRKNETEKGGRWGAYSSTGGLGGTPQSRPGEFATRPDPNRRKDKRAGSGASGDGRGFFDMPLEARQGGGRAKSWASGGADHLGYSVSPMVPNTAALPTPQSVKIGVVFDVQDNASEERKYMEVWAQYCKAYVAGRCRFGNRCRFVHEPVPEKFRSRFRKDALEYLGAMVRKRS